MIAFSAFNKSLVSVKKPANGTVLGTLPLTNVAAPVWSTSRTAPAGSPAGFGEPESAKDRSACCDRRNSSSGLASTHNGSRALLTINWISTRPYPAQRAATVRTVAIR